MRHRMLKHFSEFLANVLNCCCVALAFDHLPHNQLWANVKRDVGTRSATDLTTWSDVVPTAEGTLENVDDVDVRE